MIFEDDDFIRRCFEGNENRHLTECKKFFLIRIKKENP
jgi:hypothetical protein